MFRIAKEFLRFIKHIYQNRSLLFTLAYDDFKSQYLGSYLGLVWAVLRPLIFIITVYFVFSVGFKRVETNGIPFILYLMGGYIPWFFFSEAVLGGMNSVISNSYLVKKVAFRVSILPIVKVSSTLFLHFIFLMIYFVILIAHGYYPNIYWLQLPFYLFLISILLIGTGWLLSPLRVFIKDMAQLIGVILQLGFWVTPIFWSIEKVPEKYMHLMRLNPMVYIIEGYRNTFLYKRWFWEEPMQAFYFLGITVFILLVGAITFKRLKPHFGDVL